MDASAQVVTICGILASPFRMYPHTPGRESFFSFGGELFVRFPWFKCGLRARIFLRYDMDYLVSTSAPPRRW